MSSDLASVITPADDVRPSLNVGGLFDLITGDYLPGVHGNSIVNGGISRTTGVAARGNMGKTTLIEFLGGRALHRYNGSQLLCYDDEDSGAINRKKELYYHHTGDEEYELKFQTNAYIYTDMTKYTGDGIFHQMKLWRDGRVADAKKITRTAPFGNEDTDGKLVPITQFTPAIILLDSISMMMFSSLEKMHTDNKVGESGMNMEAARLGAAKTQMLNQLPSVLAIGQMYALMTAHVGDRVELELFPTNKKKLSFMGNLSLKYCPERFTFMTANFWLGVHMEMLNNKSTKAPEYPRNEIENKMAGATDLQLITYRQLRGKGGSSGINVDLVLSQEEGIRIDLTSFHYLRKNYNYWGLGGSQQFMEVDLYPGKKYQRTTIRTELDNDYKLQSAIHITAQLCQLTHEKLAYSRELLVTPKAMRDILTRRGYDWDVLLECRFYWVHLEDEAANPRKELSTEDLLKMCKGTYVPYWMDAAAVPKHARTPLDQLPATKEDD